MYFGLKEWYLNYLANAVTRLGTPKILNYSYVGKEKGKFPVIRR